MCSKRTQLAVEEYANITGLVSPVLAAIVARFPLEDAADADAVQLRRLLAYGRACLSPERFRQLLNVDDLPGEAGGNFHMLGGFLMIHLGRVPKVARSEQMEWTALRGDGHGSQPGKSGTGRAPARRRA